MVPRPSYPYGINPVGGSYTYLPTPGGPNPVPLRSLHPMSHIDINLESDLLFLHKREDPSNPKVWAPIVVGVLVVGGVLALIFWLKPTTPRFEDLSQEYSSTRPSSRSSQTRHPYQRPQFRAYASSARAASRPGKNDQEPLLGSAHGKYLTVPEPTVKGPRARYPESI